MEILKAAKLSKTFGEGETKVEALKDVSFSVSKGEFVSIVGPSGSGKSTLLNLLGALDVPTSGKLYLDGRDIFAMREKELAVFRRRSIGFIFQAYNLVPELNVEENIILPLLLDYKKPDKQHIDELLNVLGLTDRKHHLPGQLSGGQQQRVAIGRALAARPAIILADEPTGNLDSKNSRDVINLMKMSVDRYHQTLLMITHNQNYASCAGRVFSMEDGMLSELGGAGR
ncbi:ABC transporter ATP-binding protein [Pelotomaculum sp. PtaB.Bin117]|uniref:ABC transporter ATP-binding protein n=1 Tax=Pelotomaculum sp. PtaB.Bin117 TaxID=1811694 RepID=UPI0009D4FC2F|nr:ABC transporter ATP-binding protein [Pelotomaculum sp. PtaB.Bin117]OPX86876.1 MAG: Bacitracin export ATP-binding protein BceA [Pelotomaculum sp. PtaB.Bin117]